MPRIFDNIEASLLPALRDTLAVAERADFCVGYFNLRGWRSLSDCVDRWAGGTGHCCRLLVGMHVAPDEELRRTLRASGGEEALDNQTAIREKRRIAQEFREQLTFGVPTNQDESTLRQLSAQLRAHRLVVKVYLRHLLHAKLYLLYRRDPINPVVAYLGSSNLTLAGLAHQGELNVDVLDGDACMKLAHWFEDRWRDRWCLDVSRELADIIDESWASEKLIPPYHVYLKIAYHLAQEARVGLAEFQIPKLFGDTLFDFQIAAVKIAAHHLNQRGGVLIGDVVGLGKSMMATALARIFEDDYHAETLILCPRNLVPMWEDYVHVYRLRAKVMSLSRVIGELPEKTRRYRVVLIDESHNLRNPEGKRYRAIRITSNEMTACVFCCPPRPTTKPILIYPPNWLCSCATTPISASGRKNTWRRWGASRNSSGVTSARFAPWPRSRRVPIPTTGAISCDCTWCGAPGGSSSRITPGPIPKSGANICNSPMGGNRISPRASPRT